MRRPKSPVGMEIVIPLPELRIITVCASELSFLGHIESSRSIRLSKTHVAFLVRKLHMGGFPESPIIVSRLPSGGVRLLDGQHRIAALTAFLKDNPWVQVPVHVLMYTGLSPQQENEIVKRTSICVIPFTKKDRAKLGLPDPPKRQTFKKTLLEHREKLK